MKVFKYLIILFLILAISAFSYLAFIHISKVNVLETEFVYPGVGWKDNTSLYSGSELSFAFNNSSSISFDFFTTSKAEQVVEIFINESKYELFSPNLNDQKVTIELDKNKPYAVTVRHTCSRIEFPCQLTAEGIYIDRKARLSNYQKHNKVLTVIGDSVSTIYENKNFTQILADNLGYELHNASLNGQAVSRINGNISATENYKDYMGNFFSDVVIIYLGSNDAANNVAITDFRNDYLYIVDNAKKHNPEVILVLVGPLMRSDVPNDRLNEYTGVISQIADEKGVVFIDTKDWLSDTDFVDGIHPSLESQKKLEKNFNDLLTPIL